MNNLINKAIKAIEEGKDEYAIGLLEGVLEIFKKEELKTETPKSVVFHAPETPQINDYPPVYSESSIISLAQKGLHEE